MTFTRQKHLNVQITDVQEADDYSMLLYFFTITVDILKIGHLLKEFQFSYLNTRTSVIRTSNFLPLQKFKRT
jgi:hypothetical protein